MADIIAVDDEKGWLDLYEEKLSEAGHTVRTFENGLRALEDMKRKLPDLVILDIRMSPSGRDVLRTVRRAWPDLPIVVITAWASLEAAVLQRLPRRF